MVWGYKLHFRYNFTAPIAHYCPYSDESYCGDTKMFKFIDEKSNVISDAELYHRFRVKMRAADFAIKYLATKSRFSNNYQAKPKCSR